MILPQATSSDLIPLELDKNMGYYTKRNKIFRLDLHFERRSRSIVRTRPHDHEAIQFLVAGLEPSRYRFSVSPRSCQQNPDSALIVYMRIL